MEEVKILRLKTGEDIIAEVIHDNHQYTLVDPMRLDIRRDDRTNANLLGLDMWLPFQLIESNMATLWENDVLTVMTPTQEIVDYYYSTLAEAIETYSAHKNLTELSSTDMAEVLKAMLESDSNQLH
jgi:hypothetical protein